MKKNKQINNEPGVAAGSEYRYLAGSAAAVSIIGNTETLTVDSSTLITKSIRKESKDIEFVQWGDSNDLPVKVMNAVFSNVIVGPNIGTNAKTIYGSGVSIFKQVREESSDKLKYVEQLPSEQTEIFNFLTNNGCNRIIQEIANDMAVFGDACVEITLSKGKDKIARVRHMEMCYSRYSKIDEKEGRSLYHGYSTKWDDNASDADVTVTPLLDRKAPIRDLMIRMGKECDDKGNKEVSKEGRFVMSLSFPTPGRLYYNKPYWWSLFDSGWYDFAVAIPKFKKAILLNQMTVKYHVQINADFWIDLYTKKGIEQHDRDKQIEAQNEFYKELDNYLSGVDNANKSFTSTFKYNNAVDAKMLENIIIKKIDSTNKGGEYIDDSEEVANIICFAMEVHPSLNGAAPGKNKSINGTEARELFIIKQEMQRPTRDMILTFMHAVKKANGWDDDIYFGIKNAQLTTLDKGTGSEKSIGNEEV